MGPLNKKLCLPQINVQQHFRITSSIPCCCCCWMWLWWHSSPLSLLPLWQVCSAASHISRHNECSLEYLPTQAHLRESINDVDDGRGYWYGTLVEATYQLRNGFANNARLYGEWLKDADAINTHSPRPAPPFLLHTFTSAYKKEWEPGRESMDLRFLLKTAVLSAIRARNSYPESHDGTWSRAAGAQGRTRCIHPQRAGWTHSGPSEVLETIRFCFAVHQPVGGDVIKSVGQYCSNKVFQTMLTY